MTDFWMGPDDDLMDACAVLCPVNADQAQALAEEAAAAAKRVNSGLSALSQALSAKSIAQLSEAVAEEAARARALVCGEVHATGGSGGRGSGSGDEGAMEVDAPSHCTTTSREGGSAGAQSTLDGGASRNFGGPIGLKLRKSQSLLSLVSHLRAGAEAATAA